ncbi:MAG: MMPL family transporter [Gammaproteobacteria bacterium]|nr:MMPL family transporter [Gammaproteobacteria bacterium]
MFEKLTLFSIDRPKTVIALMTLITVVFGFQFPSVTIDADPENMLDADQADRVFYNQTKDAFGIHDLIVVGVVDETDVFRPESLEGILRATTEILKIDGVIIEDVISPSTTDNVKSSGGLLDIHPVLREIPRTSQDEAVLRKDIADNSFLHEKIASADGTAIALYIPIEQKDMSYRIAGEIETILARELLSGQQYHLAGLPVSEDTFGYEMFIQMAIVAPLAFMVILAIVFLMFRQSAFLVPVAITAMFSVLWAMGALIGLGFTVHIMSSMIPVFLMPIAILDDIHILSEFFDRYRVLGDKRRALIEAMRPLYKPMLYTSLTSGVGFASLALADIPPVRIFGLFVAFGIGVAWLLALTIVPAVISLMDDEKLKRRLFRAGDAHSGPLYRLLDSLGNVAFSRARAVLVLGIAAFAFGLVGLGQIEVNDNPVKWFKADHPLRHADTVMNDLFGGTYMAYLVIDAQEAEAIKRPEVVTYIDRLQENLEADPLVGKTSSVADIVKRINLVLHDNDPTYDTVPESSEAVGQFLFLFQSSGDPNDLDNFIDREEGQANIWLQMKGGDNRQMQDVENRLAEFVQANPLPTGLSLQLSGLTYINKVWQDLMVTGMLKAVLGSFLVVFLLMLLEFRSLTFGVLAMVPLTGSIVLTYGLVGWIGLDYNMPIAVCAALTLGLGIDFAIHFLQRFKAHVAESRDVELTNQHMFSEPGRAIARNAIIITIGFLPLTLSTLSPYITVGLFFASLMLFCTLATLFMLPAALRFVGDRVIPGGVS